MQISYFLNFKLTV